MCGICGIIDATDRKDLHETLRRMNHLAAHRGPDGSGLIMFNPYGRCSIKKGGQPGTLEAEASIQWQPCAGRIQVGLAHRRLSIIDLSELGNQPMSDSTGLCWIVFNGEIYNYREIRLQLEEAGVVFRSQTDTEVVVEAYKQWGRDCLTRFNGMWSFVILDMDSEALFCARDRFGVKPFFFQARSGRFVFASELKQFKAMPDFKAKANDSAIADFLLWCFHSHTEESFLDGIKCLPASHAIWLPLTSIKDGRVEPYKYWEAGYEAMNHSPDKENHARFRSLLEDAVQLRLRSDVPVGITLSGGLDSSSVAVLSNMHSETQKEHGLRAFTAVFNDKGFSELDFAKQVALHAELEHVVVRPEADALAGDWWAFAQTMEEPFGGLSYYSNWKIFEKIAEFNVPVILTGQGGDELLLGYERYRVPVLFEWLRKGKWLIAAREADLARTRANLSFLKQALYGMYFRFPWIRTQRRRHLVAPYLKRRFYHRWMHHTEGVYDALRVRNKAELQEKEFFAYQLQHLLQHDDRVSMNFSIETRQPFLDYRLYELLIGFPSEALFKDGWSKFLLRRAMTDVLPNEVCWRTDKMGFDTPTMRFFLNNKTTFMPILERHNDNPWVDVKTVKSAFEAGRINEGLLCSILSLLTWREIFGIDR